jgi:hypothetical protein
VGILALFSRWENPEILSDLPKAVSLTLTDRVLILQFSLLYDIHARCSLPFLTYTMLAISLIQKSQY